MGLGREGWKTNLGDIHNRNGRDLEKICSNYNWTCILMVLIYIDIGSWLIQVTTPYQLQVCVESDVKWWENYYFWAIKRLWTSDHGTSCSSTGILKFKLQPSRVWSNWLSASVREAVAQTDCWYQFKGLSFSCHKLSLAHGRISLYRAEALWDLWSRSRAFSSLGFQSSFFPMFIISTIIRT
jgi:hypothetical protein